MQGADRELVKVWQKLNAPRFDNIMLKTRTKFGYLIPVIRERQELAQTCSSHLGVDRWAVSDRIADIHPLWSSDCFAAGADIQAQGPLGYSFHQMKRRKK